MTGANHRRIRNTLVYENDDVDLLDSYQQQGYRTTPILYINGKKVPNSKAIQAKPNQTLLSFLRDVMLLTGSKLGCAEGGCGACTVMISRPKLNQSSTSTTSATSTGTTGTDTGNSDSSNGTTESEEESVELEHVAVNACLMPVLAADGCHVLTVEGIGSVKPSRGTTNGSGRSSSDQLHPVQKAMVDMHGSQCGFCTPGIIVAIYSLLAQNPTKAYMEEHLDGNLCRCTGYRPIWDAARTFCTDNNDDGTATTTDESLVRGPCGTPCRQCPERNECEMECNQNDKVIAQNGKKIPNDDDCNTNKCQKEHPDPICTSTSMDKIIQCQSQTNYTHQDWEKWHPNYLYPEELLSTQMVQDIQKSLVVVDRTYHKVGTWLKPNSLFELLKLLKTFQGECKIVVGNTEVGIETKFKHSVYQRLIYPSTSISSLYTIDTTNPTHLSIGSCTSLSTLQHVCETLIHNEKTNSTFTRIAKPMHDMLRWFASTQIRNVACLGGNLATASPISDMNPMLASLGATLVIASCSDNESTTATTTTTTTAIQRRNIAVSDFFISYRTTALEPHELLECIHVPVTAPVFEYAFPFKQARRREDDISIVTSGMRIKVKPLETEYIIEDISLAFGGMAPTTVMATKTASFMTGKSISKVTFVEAQKVLIKELELPDTVPGGQAQFRMTLASSFLYKLYLMTVKSMQSDVEKIQKEQGSSVTSFSSCSPWCSPDDQAASSTDSITSCILPPLPVIDEAELSGAESFLEQAKPSTTGSQTYPASKVSVGLEGKANNSTATTTSTSSPTVTAVQEEKKNDDNNIPTKLQVGKGSHHASGPLHCTGEALYTDDIPLPPTSLHASLILATTCNAKLVSIDTNAALSTPGVVAVYTSTDVAELGGDNHLGPIQHDEFLFLPIGEHVGFVGQPIGICVAESLESAESGARSVEIEYEYNSEKTIVSIEDAIEAGSFYDFARHTMTRSKPISLIDGDKVHNVEGSFRCGGQEHFYLETNSTLAVPSESATNLTIYTSTQAVTKTQMYCASCTNTQAAKVVVRMKRMGGGFGGKETRSVFASCATAVAAKLSDRPVRLTLGRDVDMSITGGRHAFLAKYNASAVVTKSGEVRLQSLNVELFSNGGSAFDLSGPVMDRALFHVDGPYYWPEFHAVGVPCKTVQPPHTAFRGFGGPQGLATCEHIMDHLASKMNICGDKLRRDSMYKDGNATPFGMIMGEDLAGKWNVPNMWDKLHHELNVKERREMIADFNSKHKWVKRGLAMLPTKFGIAFTAKFMNQGGALVHVYTDGTILVTHGGTEMGQGLHTKVCQIAAQAFGVPLDDVYVNDSSSDKVANTIPTAASMSTDMYGMATLDACRKILKRLEPIREKLGPDATLKAIASEAFFQRIDLSAHGFFALDNSRCGYEWDKDKPDDFPSNAPDNSWKGHPFNYFTQGVAYAEVEVDLLTGNHTTLRADVLVDVGSSINPALDIGQIEGAFIQGMGWCTMEEVIYGDDDHTWIRPRGKVFTSGPGTYKIPAFNDVPQIFNVSLMNNVDNPFAVHSSKAIGEPPFFLGCSVFYAVKDALKNVRNGEEYFELRMPATSERIRMACIDDIAVSCGGSESLQVKGSH